MKNICLIIVLTLMSISTLASDTWDFQRNEEFFNNLQVCRTSCSQLCNNELDLAQEIMTEYVAVCQQGAKPNYNFFHYCGYQCTRVCRLQVMANMRSAIAENQEFCQ